MLCLSTCSYVDCLLDNRLGSTKIPRLSLAAGLRFSRAMKQDTSRETWIGCSHRACFVSHHICRPAQMSERADRQCKQDHDQIILQSRRFWLSISQSGVFRPDWSNVSSLIIWSWGDQLDIGGGRSLRCIFCLRWVQHLWPILPREYEKTMILMLEDSESVTCRQLALRFSGWTWWQRNEYCNLSCYQEAPTRWTRTWFMSLK